jgi:hypothetical protein
VASLVLGVILGLLAVPALLGSILLLKVSSDEFARAPIYEAALDLLWESEGVRIPGEASLTLPGGLQDAYLETGESGEGGVEIEDIAVVDPDTGELLSVTFREATEEETFHRNGRVLRRKASVWVPEDGQYSISVITSGTEFPDARIKVGLSAGSLNGGEARLVRGIGIGVLVVGLLIAAGSVFLLLHYYRLRKQLSSS